MPVHVRSDDRRGFGRPLERLQEEAANRYVKVGLVTDDNDVDV
jgi:hypothetical protein